MLMPAMQAPASLPGIIAHNGAKLRSPHQREKF